MAIEVPIGHITVNEKWYGTELVSVLSQQVKVDFFSSETTDFHIAPDSAVFYMTEGAIITGKEHRKRIVKFRKIGIPKSIIFFEKTEISTPYFKAVQDFIVIELRLHVLPVSGQKESAELLASLVKRRAAGSPDPFAGKKRYPPIQVSILTALETIPSLGPVKAQALLENFTSLGAIVSASVSDLEKIIGHSSALKVHEFFGAPTS